MSRFSGNMLMKVFGSLPLWMKIALPALLIIIGISLINTLGWVFKLGVVALVIYLLASAVLYFKENSTKRR